MFSFIINVILLFFVENFLKFLFYSDVLREEKILYKLGIF